MPPGRFAGWEAPRGTRSTIQLPTRRFSARHGGSVFWRLVLPVGLPPPARYILVCVSVQDEPFEAGETLLSLHHLGGLLQLGRRQDGGLFLDAADPGGSGRVGGSAPVVHYADEKRALAFGPMPEGATTLAGRTGKGKSLSCHVGLGVWLVDLGKARTARVEFRDGLGKLVSEMDVTPRGHPRRFWSRRRLARRASS